MDSESPNQHHQSLDSGHESPPLFMLEDDMEHHIIGDDDSDLMNLRQFGWVAPRFMRDPVDELAEENFAHQFEFPETCAFTCPPPLPPFQRPLEIATSIIRCTHVAGSVRRGMVPVETEFELYTSLRPAVGCMITFSASCLSLQKRAASLALRPIDHPESVCLAENLLERPLILSPSVPIMDWSITRDPDSGMENVFTILVGIVRAHNIIGTCIPSYKLRRKPCSLSGMFEFVYTFEMSTTSGAITTLSVTTPPLHVIANRGKINALRLKKAQVSSSST